MHRKTVFARAARALLVALTLLYSGAVLAQPVARPAPPEELPPAAATQDDKAPKTPDDGDTSQPTAQPAQPAQPPAQPAAPPNSQTPPDWPAAKPAKAAPTPAAVVPESHPPAATPEPTEPAGATTQFDPTPLAAVTSAPPRNTNMPSNRAPTGRRVTQQNNRFGLGLTGSWAHGSGFSFRTFFGRTSIQGTFFAMVTERGQDATVFAGLSATRYLLVWHEFNRPGLLPDTSALRLTGGASYLHRKSLDRNTTSVKIDSTCSDTLGNPCSVTQKIEETASNKWDAFFGVGIGFEFGAVMRPGFSLSLDLVLTAMVDRQGLYEILPVPAIGLMYNW